MGGEMFKRRLVRGVAVAIPARNNFVALLRALGLKVGVSYGWRNV